jgi:RHS repeat-associated protein
VGAAHRYRYDSAGRLVSVRDEVGNTVERYLYGADRRRLASFDAAGNGTIYQWRDSEIVAEYSVSAQQDFAWKRSFVRDHGILVASFSAGPTGAPRAEFTVTDQARIRLAIGLDPTTTDVSSEQVEVRPFGSNTPGQPVSVARFLNYRHSTATGLDYAIHRNYDGRLGRFLEPDPLGSPGANPGDPQAVNLYAYALNDPVNRADPTGLRFINVTQVDEGCMQNQTEEYGLVNCTTVHSVWIPDSALGPGPVAPSDRARTGPGLSADPTSDADLISGIVATAAVLAALGGAATSRQLEALARVFELIKSLTGAPMQRPPSPIQIPPARPVAPISGSPPPVAPEVEAALSRWVIVGETIISRMWGALPIIPPCYVERRLCSDSSGPLLY